MPDPVPARPRSAPLGCRPFDGTRYAPPVMRIARVVDRLPPAPGGKEIHAAELSRALARLGVDQHLFCRVGDRVDPRVGQSWCPVGPRPATRRTLAAFAAWSIAALARE